MGALLLVVTAVLCVAALRTSPRTALAVVLFSIALVPGSLTVPGAPGVLTVHRLVLLAAGANVVLRRRRGQLRCGLLLWSGVCCSSWGSSAF
ncbi:MAG: hypothetical protein JF597_01010 [Streptomyces sp.]|uniref:hypothetical protein n=1 Tax=Streptomyces sp. TaxID=1931 RepID=UPI0025F1017F|nr:hypothetical protein [Streptomyces sp.]MBW8792218.1 hypothetical protein [Streptomyces sp.]